MADRVKKKPAPLSSNAIQLRISGLKYHECYICIGIRYASDKGADSDAKDGGWEQACVISSTILLLVGLLLVAFGLCYVGRGRRLLAQGHGEIGAGVFQIR
jgi:hypothetical protein